MSATNPTPTPRTDGDDRQYPLPEHAQRIVFEGCDSVVVSPEAYEALYDLACTLECKLTSAQAALAAKDAEIEKLRAESPSYIAQMIEEERDQFRADLAAAKDWRNQAEGELIKCGERIGNLCSKLAAAKEDSETLNFLLIYGIRLDLSNGLDEPIRINLSRDDARARIDAARKAQP